MVETRRVLVDGGRRDADPEDSLVGDGWAIQWRRLAGGLSEGVEVVTLETSDFQVQVCPTRGMGVIAAQAGEASLGWHSPVRRPVHPAYINLQSRNGLGWLDGFNELLCRCGLAWNGPPGIDEGAASPIESQLTLHGRIANTPAHRVEVGFDGSAVWISGECSETTMFGPQLVLRSTLRVPMGAAGFEVEDTISNAGGGPTDLQLLYHINIGPPFLEEGSHFLTSFGEICPRDARAAEDIDGFSKYAAPTAGYAEQVYFFDVLPDADGRATGLLRNRGGDLGVSIRYPREQLPCLSQWKCTQAMADGYVTGIEPGTNFPNFKSFERAQGRVVRLAPDASWRATLNIDVHLGTDAVQAVVGEIEQRQAQVRPTIHRSPSPPFAGS